MMIKKKIIQTFFLFLNKTKRHTRKMAPRTAKDDVQMAQRILFPILLFVFLWFTVYLADLFIGMVTERSHVGIVPRTRDDL
jgi:hypothetical protein